MQVRRLEKSMGEPFLFVTCAGARRDNHHLLEIIVHFDQKTDEAYPVTEFGEVIGYTYVLKNFESLGSCQFV